MVLVKIFPTLADMPFMVDVPGGLMYAQITGDIPSYLEHVRLEAHAVGGYACAPLEAGNAAYDAWGFQPVGLELMRGIKARWDEQGVLNPGAFLF
jgi:hypothetical protein